jgi:hypothetical protein
MSLNTKRAGEIAMLVLQDRLERQNDIRLNPHEIRSEIMTSAKRLNLTPQEAAEFARIIIKNAFGKTMQEIDAIIASQKGEN